MANRIKPKRSLTGQKVPDNLEQHELAINVTDKKIYIGGVAGAPVLLADYNNANNPFDQVLNKSSAVTFGTVTNGAVTLINTKGNANQYIASNGDGTTKWTTPTAGQSLVDGNKTLTFGNSQDNTIYFPAATVSANGGAIRTATNEPFSIISYNDTGAGTFYKFKFQNAGMTFPDLTTQTTAFVGTATTAAGLSATLAVASGGTGVTSSTGTGSVVLSTSPTLITPILGTPQSGDLKNCTFPTFNQNTTGNAATATKCSTVTTNANLTGIVTSIGNATSIANGAIGNALLANTAVGKLYGSNTGDDATNARYESRVGNLDHTGDVITTSPGTSGLTVVAIGGKYLNSFNGNAILSVDKNGTLGAAVAGIFPILNQNTTGTAAGLSATLAVASGGTGVTSGTGTGANVLSTSPTLITPILGTPQSGDLKNCTFPTFNQNTTGTASKATTVTTNANLTGVVTSIGNATSIANGAIGNALLANAAVATLSGTNTGDNAVNSLYAGIVSNATHTGDATGATVLTVSKINGVSLAGLATGILKNTTTTGVPSIATAGDFPTLNQNTTGTAAGLSVTLAVASGGTGVTSSTGTGANVLSTSPTLITPNLGTPASGNLANCVFPTLNQNTTGNAATATALSATLTAAKGGTGLTTAGAAGNVLTSDGVVWTSAAPPAAGAVVLTGSITAYGGASVPAGYLECDGSAINSSNYLALHLAISNLYGGAAYTGAGGLSFNLPDFRGRSLLGVGAGSGLTSRTAGTKGGAQSATLTTSNMPSHNHTIYDPGHSHSGTTNYANANHTHGTHHENSGISIVGSTNGGTRMAYSQVYGINTYSQENGYAHTHTFGTSPAGTGTQVNYNGSGTSFEIMPPWAAVKYLIKT